MRTIAAYLLFTAVAVSGAGYLAEGLAAGIAEAQAARTAQLEALR